MFALKSQSSLKENNQFSNSYYLSRVGAASSFLLAFGAFFAFRKKKFFKVMEKNVSQEKLNHVMKSYSDKLSEAKVFERILPRKFKEKADVDNLIYNMSYSNAYDLDSLNKVHHYKKIS
jgi:hypothetical protein